MAHSPSEGSLQGLVEQLLPQLAAEIGATQDEVRRASERLGRVPPALLQGESELHLGKARRSLDAATDQLTQCLGALYAHYPESREDLS
jgi:hypothetical protein